MYPTMLEKYWSTLSGSEQKCLDYILRKTIGWRKSGDSISWSQFTSGNGSTDMGTGLSKSQVRRATARLEELGFIKILRNTARANYFQLVLEDSAFMEEMANAISVFVRDTKPEGIHSDFQPVQKEH